MMDTEISEAMRLQAALGCYVESVRWFLGIGDNRVSYQFRICEGSALRLSEVVDADMQRRLCADD